MSFLDINLFNNSIEDWCIAIGIVIASFVAVKISYWIIANVVKKITAKTKTKLDDILIETLEKPVVYFLLLFGCWIAFHYL